MSEHTEKDPLPSEPPQDQAFKPYTFENQVKVNDSVLFTIPLQMQYPEFVEQLRLKRPTRWGERRLRKNNIIEDVVFNPVDGLIKKSTLLALTQDEGTKLAQLTTEYAPIRKSKWGDPNQQTFKPPMLNYISPKIPVDELEYIIRLLRLDQINSQMNFDIPDDPVIRAPSPDPIYNSEGIRINTRANLKKMALQKERVNLIEDCMRMKNTFRPPAGYKKQKKKRKIYIPDTILGQPGTNFIGKIIGPGGNTQKLLQAKTGCKIAIRGRGSNSRSQDLDSYDQLHVLVQAQTDPQVEAGSDLISKILMGTEDVQFKRENEKQIALMKGVFSQNYCQNCKETGHRTWACPKKMTARVSVRCGICGEYSHPSMDCPQKGKHSEEQLEKMGVDYSGLKQEMKEEKIKNNLSLITDGEENKMLKE